MFTGLVAELGRVRSIRAGSEGATLDISCTFEELVLGESIAVNGCCLTVTSISSSGFTADASRETLDKTTTAQLAAGDAVHLERALRLGDRLGGHLVSGHVDGVGRLVARKPLGDAQCVRFEVPETLAPMLAPKGSVTLDGVSLTVNAVEGRSFEVALIPHTREKTVFDQRALGAAINVEVDILAKYVARLLGHPGVDGSGGGGGERLTLDLLVKSGFAKQ